MAEINLLPVEEKDAETFSLLQKRLTVVSVVVLVVAVVLTLGTLIFFTKVASDRTKLNKQIDELTFEINSKKNTEELIVVVKKKASAANNLLLGRVDYTIFFEDLSQLVPAGVYFSDLKISGKKITLNGKAKTSAELAGLISEMVSERGTAVVSNLKIDSLSSDENRTYAFSLSMEIANKSAKKS